MSRRVKLPGADELFRPTKSDPEAAANGAANLSANGAANGSASATTKARTNGSANGTAPADASAIQASGPSGRVRHDEKITVYVTADELIDLEDTRLTLRREHGLAVDRGRIVREAIHLALASVDSDGANSPLVRRLQES
jgi:hypothetical protein